MKYYQLEHFMVSSIV